MTVSKRTRFEVLRRDNYTCRYCRSAGNPLTVDHVIPVALGGSDNPDNLVAACKDCNSGKASIAPDAALVADVAADALRWATAFKRAVREHLIAQGSRDTYAREFLSAWKGFDHELVDLPDDWESTVHRWHSAGVPLAILTDAFNTAWVAFHVPTRRVFRYMSGVVRNRMEEISARAYELAVEDTTDGS